MAAGPQARGAGAALPATSAPPAPPEALSAKNVLLAVGTASLAGMVAFYRRKHTAGFKACWAVMCAARRARARARGHAPRQRRRPRAGGLRRAAGEPPRACPRHAPAPRPPPPPLQVAHPGRRHHARGPARPPAGGQGAAGAQRSRSVPPPAARAGRPRASFTSTGSTPTPRLARPPARAARPPRGAAEAAGGERGDQAARGGRPRRRGRPVTRARRAATPRCAATKRSALPSVGAVVGLHACLCNVAGRPPPLFAGIDGVHRM